MSENKYKMFRNFMVNELGITKEEIEQWTKDAVAEQVTKLVHSMNVVKMTEDQIRKQIPDYFVKGELTKAIASAAVEDAKDRIVRNLETLEKLEISEKG